jgi:hypothetical protein
MERTTGCTRYGEQVSETDYVTPLGGSWNAPLWWNVTLTLLSPHYKGHPETIMQCLSSCGQTSMYSGASPPFGARSNRWKIKKQGVCIIFCIKLGEKRDENFWDVTKFILVMSTWVVLARLNGLRSLKKGRTSLDDDQWSERLLTNGNDDCVKSVRELIRLNRRSALRQNSAQVGIF